jgi:GntR family transcriptional regulator
MPIRARSEYEQLADALRSAIERGEYAPGAVLPAEPELGERYGVGRPTVNRAIAILRNEGLVRVERGRGTIVRAIPAIRRDGTTRYDRVARERNGGRGAFDGEIRALGMTPRSDVTVDRVVPPPAVAQALGLPENQPNTIIRARRMYADQTPVQYAPSYIPLDIAEGTQLAEVDSGPGGIVSRFADLGQAQVRITETVRVRRPDEAEREFLRLDRDQPVIEIFHVGWTAEDRAVEVCVHTVPAYLWILEYGFPIS